MGDLEGIISQIWTAVPWGTWTRALLLVLFGFIFGRLAGRTVERVLAPKATRHQAALLRRLVFYTLFVLFVVSAMRELGFAPDVLLGAAGILTVAIGFASQTSASNMISGLFLLVEKPFEIGDTIDVETTIGEVIAIDMLSVKLRTPDNLFVRLPNEMLIKAKVINRSRFPIRRLDLIVGIAYAEDAGRVEALLLALAGSNRYCLQEPAPFVQVSNFGPSSVDLQFSFWVPSDAIRQGRSSMLMEIKTALEREAIEIPFPHTSVYAGSHSAPFRVELIRPGEVSNKPEEATDESGRS